MLITAKELATKVKLMREAQNEFFRTKSFQAMDKAKKLERQVDEDVKTVLSYGQPVTGDLFQTEKP